MKKENNDKIMLKTQLFNKPTFFLIAKSVLFGYLLSKLYLFYDYLIPSFYFRDSLTENIVVYISNFIIFILKLIYPLYPSRNFVLFYFSLSTILLFLLFILRKNFRDEKRILHIYLIILIIIALIFLILSNIYFGLPYEMGGGAFS